MTPTRLEPTVPRSRVKHSSTEPLRSHLKTGLTVFTNTFFYISWVKIFRIIPEFGILRLTFHRIKQIINSFADLFKFILRKLTIKTLNY